MQQVIMSISFCPLDPKPVNLIHPEQALFLIPIFYISEDHWYTIIIELEIQKQKHANRLDTQAKKNQKTKEPCFALL